MDKIAEYVDEAFKNAGHDYHQVLVAVAEHLRRHTDFFANDFQAVISTIFVRKTGDNHTDSALQSSYSTNFDGSIDKSNSGNATPTHRPKTVDEASADMFDDCDDRSTSHESIIPETQYAPSDTEDEDHPISFQYPELTEANLASAQLDIRKNASTSTVTASERAALKSDIADNLNDSRSTNDTDDFARIGADSTQAETQLLHSQALLLHIDESFETAFGDVIANERTTRAQSEQSRQTTENDEVMSLTNGSKSSANDIDPERNERLVNQRSDMVTPDLDIATFTSDNVDCATKTIDDNNPAQSGHASQMYDATKKTEDTSIRSADDGIFEKATQKMPVAQDDDDDDDDDDVYVASTQKLATKTDNYFAIPKAPIEKAKQLPRRRSVRHTSSPNDSKKANTTAEREKQSDDDDLFDIATQRLSPKLDIFDADTQPVDREAQPDADGDIFEDLTQKLPVPVPTRKSTDAAKKHVQFAASTRMQSKEGGTSDDVYEQATQQLVTSTGNDGDIYEMATQQMHTPPTSSGSPKPVSKVPSIRLQHKVVPNTPDWSCVKNISSSDIQSYENTTSATKEPPQRSRSVFSIPDEDNDYDDFELDLHVRTPAPSLAGKIKPLASDKNSVAAKPVSESMAVTKSASVSNLKIMARRCSVNLKRVPMDMITSVTSGRENNSAEAHENNNNVSDDKKTASSRGSKRPASKPIESVDTKRKTRNDRAPAVEKTMDGSRRLRGQVSPKVETRSRKRGAEQSTDDDHHDTKAKKSRTKREKTATETVQHSALPKRTSARTKSRAESVDQPTPNVNDIDALMSFNTKRRSNRKCLADQQKPLRILCTKVDPAISKPFAHIIQKLGGCSVETPQIGDILICDKVYRTFKFLFALCKGIPIVRSRWLEVSNTNGAFEPTEPYLLIDYDAEKRFKFTLKESIAIARKTKLFANYQVFTTPNVQPIPDEIAEIVQHCGGTYSYTLLSKAKPNAKLILFSHRKDSKLWPKYQNAYPHIEIVDSEGFMQSVMQQRISISNHLLA